MCSYLLAYVSFKYFTMGDLVSVRKSPLVCLLSYYVSPLFRMLAQAVVIVVEELSVCQDPLQVFSLQKIVKP